MKKTFFYLSILSAAVSNVYAVNFTCPAPSEIESTDFTAPSIWIAPPVTGSASGRVGVGLGGKEVQQFLGVEPAKINRKDGWVCIYQSKGGTSIPEYKAKIREIVASNRYLKKHLEKVDKAFKSSEESFLSKYSDKGSIGFVGYQQAK